MVEREKVIKGLECCAVGCRSGCLYSDIDDCESVLCADALALLKAQEPVEPIENAGFYYCGACRYAFTSARQKYCSECGRAVKWEWINS